jgi:hypothetical protein
MMAETANLASGLGVVKEGKIMNLPWLRTQSDLQRRFMKRTTATATDQDHNSGQPLLIKEIVDETAKKMLRAIYAEQKESVQCLTWRLSGRQQPPFASGLPQRVAK